MSIKAMRPFRRAENQAAVADNQLTANATFLPLKV
jgi:hypothetical protein